MKVNLAGLIPIAGGMYGLLVAYGKVQASKNPEQNEVWRRKFGTMIKILSPLIILFGLAQLFLRIP